MYQLTMLMFRQTFFSYLSEDNETLNEQQDRDEVNGDGFCQKLPDDYIGESEGLIIANDYESEI